MSLLPHIERGPVLDFRAGRAGLYLQGRQTWMLCAGQALMIYPPRAARRVGGFAAVASRPAGAAQPRGPISRVTQSWAVKRRWLRRLWQKNRPRAAP